MAIIAGTITTAQAGQRWGGKNLSPDMKAQMEEKRAEMREKREAMQEIFANNDYDAWESLMQEKVELMRQKADEFASKINSDAFSKMLEIHELMADGKYEEARELREELGFGLGHGMRGGKMGFGKRLLLE